MIFHKIAEKPVRHRKTYEINFIGIKNQVISQFPFSDNFHLSIFLLTSSYAYHVLFEVPENFHCDTTSTNSSVLTDKIESFSIHFTHKTFLKFVPI